MSLEFCGRLRSAGCQVEFIQRNDDPHPPDCRIELDGRWVTIEFKALHEPDAMQPWHEFEEWFHGQFPSSHDPAIGMDVECAEPALVEQEAFLEGLLSVQKSGVTTFQEFPRGTGRARCNGENIWKWQYPVPATLDRTESSANCKAVGERSSRLPKRQLSLLSALACCSSKRSKSWWLRPNRQPPA